MPPEATLARRSSLGYQVNHLARLFAQALRAHIEPHGVVPGQFAQLLALYEEDGITQNELCARVRIDQSTMAHTLKRMERDGLVKRVPDPSDGRRSIITLTDRAHSLRGSMIEAAKAVNATATRDMSADEAATYLALSSRMIANLEPGTSLERTES